LRIMSQQGYNPQHSEINLPIIEVGAGTGLFVRFAKRALESGYKYRLYDCSDVAIETARELLGEAVLGENGAMKFDVHEIVKYGILHDLINQQSEEFALGIFFRVLQHNQKWIKDVLQELPFCALPFGRIVIAHPYGDDNAASLYSASGKHRPKPFSRKFILDQINYKLEKSNQWVYLREDKHQRGRELYTFAVLGPKRLDR
jgi:hypothetical protein